MKYSIPAKFVAFLLTVIMLVSALAGRENILNAYQEAVREKYRFFSFGDAMFITD